MKLVATLATAAILTFAATPSEAALINLSDGTAGTIPGGATNEFITAGYFGNPVGGYYGSQIILGAAATLKFEFFGAEAGFHNEFNFNGGELFDHAGGQIMGANVNSPLATFLSGLVSAGLIDFNFDVNNNTGGVANGANPDDFNGQANGPNFFASCNPFGGAAGSGGTTCNTVYLFLDDGGAGPDDNHDDFLVRITATAVPEPVSLGLLGLGLLGAGIAARRRR